MLRSADFTDLAPMTPKFQPSTALLKEQEWILSFLQDKSSNFKFTIPCITKRYSKIFWKKPQGFKTNLTGFFKVIG